MKKVIDWVTIKFLIVGVINTLVGSAVMFCCIMDSIPDTGLLPRAIILQEVLLSYFLNKHFTFRSKEKSLREVITFAVNIVICYVLAYGIAKPCVYQIFSGYGTKIQDNIAMFAGMCLFVGLNYFGQRFVVFKGGKE